MQGDRRKGQLQIKNQTVVGSVNFGGSQKTKYNGRKAEKNWKR